MAPSGEGGGVDWGDRDTTGLPAVGLNCPTACPSMPSVSVVLPVGTM
jgi:hypothetical protein